MKFNNFTVVAILASDFQTEVAVVYVLTFYKVSDVHYRQDVSIDLDRYYAT